MPDWFRLRLSVDCERSERLIAELWGLGTIGIEESAGSGICRISAFFASAESLPPECIRPDSPFWGRFQASLDGAESITDRDWMEPFRRRTSPFSLGRRFVVDPREPEAGAMAGTSGRALLRLPARRAFGTGSHASTRLVVEWLEDLAVAGWRVLDVGTGTGILALVALRLGAASVIAIDIDPAAVFLARANQELNGIRFGLVAGSPAVLAGAGRFDLALVNVLPENVAGDLEEVARSVRAGGRALFSGILVASGPRFAEQLEDAGFAVVDSRDDEDGEWRALMTVRRHR